MAPTPYRVTRSIRIDAPAGRVFDLIDDFREWVSWSPWEGLDPDLQRTYAGPPRGAGSSYAWSGNRQAGAGTMTIESSTAPVSDAAGSVAIDLAFEKPFRNRTKVAFTVTPVDAAASDVEWAMDGEYTGAMKVFARFMSMDKMIGRDFEKGLAQLKARAERESATA